MTAERPSLPRGGVPRYARIAALIRADITHGRYPLGSRIPSEPEVRDEYTVSKTTADAALRMLADEGLIERRTGLGSYVIRVPQLAQVELPRDATVIARPSHPGELAGELAGQAVLVLVIRRDGQPDQVYDAATTVLHSRASGSRKLDCA